MPALTRRRDRNAKQESWLIYYTDVHVGTIGLRSGNPTTTDLWEWRCGFYPGAEPGDGSSGTAATFWEARKAFEAAWRIFLAKRTDAQELKQEIGLGHYEGRTWRGFHNHGTLRAASTDS